MPNWVMNELTCIFQTTEEYNAFKEKAKIEGLYNSFIPMPSVLENTRSPHIEPDAFIAGVNSRKNTTFVTLDDVMKSDDKWDADCAKEIARNVKAFSETGYHEWYAWNLDNWGVKWDACKCKISNDSLESNSITFAFDSPWGTPEHFVRELSKLYPEATFEMVSGSIENDCHYEFTCEDGKFEETCSYETFKEAVVDGKWGGWDEWADLLEESE